MTAKVGFARDIVGIQPGIASRRVEELQFHENDAIPKRDQKLNSLK